MKPIRNKVLVKPYPSDMVSSGGIIVSEAHRSVSNKMKVIAVGDGTKKEPMRFKEGETVYRIKDCGDEIIMGGERYFLVNQSWLIAKS